MVEVIDFNDKKDSLENLKKDASTIVPTEKDFVKNLLEGIYEDSPALKELTILTKDSNNEVTLYYIDFKE